MASAIECLSGAIHCRVCTEPLDDVRDSNERPYGSGNSFASLECKVISNKGRHDGAVGHKRCNE